MSCSNTAPGGFFAMIEHDNHFSSTNTHNRWLVVLGILVLTVGGYAAYLGAQALDLKRQFAAVQQDNATLRAKLSDTDTQLQGALNSLRQDLSQAQEDASASVAKAANAATAASRHADVVASQLARKTSEEAQQ